MCSTHHYYYHCTKYTAILSVTVRNTFLTAPRIRLFVSFFVLYIHTHSPDKQTHAREETRWSPLSAPSWSDFYLAFSLSFSVYYSMLDPGYPYYPSITIRNRSLPRTAEQTKRQLRVLTLDCALTSQGIYSSLVRRLRTIAATSYGT